MKKITPTDIPKDLIEQLAERLQVDNVMAADMLAHLSNVMAEKRWVRSRPLRL